MYLHHKDIVRLISEVTNLNTQQAAVKVNSFVNLNLKSSDSLHFKMVEIQKDIASAFNLDYYQLFFLQKHDHHYVLIRYLVYYVLRKDFNFSLPSIASYFGNNHTTVIHGVSTIDNRIEIYNDVKNMRIVIKNLISKHLNQYKN